MADRSLHVGLLVLELYLPFSSSLKDKRRVIRSFCERARARHNLASAEVGFHDLLQRASLAFVSVASNPTVLEKIFDDLLDEAERAIPGGVSVSEREIIE